MLATWKSRAYQQLSRLLNLINVDPVQFTTEWKRDRFTEIVKARRESGMLLSVGDAYNLISATQATNNIDGDIAEIGSFRGGSAKLIDIM